MVKKGKCMDCGKEKFLPEGFCKECLYDLSKEPKYFMWGFLVSLTLVFTLGLTYYEKLTYGFSLGVGFMLMIYFGMKAFKLETKQKNG